MNQNLYKYLLIVLVTLLQIQSSCNSKPKTPKKDSIYFEGKFVKIEKVNTKEYDLTLKDTFNNLCIFRTLMPINENEIKLLNSNGNNIELTYYNFVNPATNQTIKIVKSFEPVYNFK